MVPTSAPPPHPTRPAGIPLARGAAPDAARQARLPERYGAHLWRHRGVALRPCPCLPALPSRAGRVCVAGACTQLQQESVQRAGAPLARPRPRDQRRRPVAHAAAAPARGVPTRARPAPPATQAMLARWAPQATAGTALDMLAEMTRLTGEVMVRALFGTALPEAVGRTMFADFTTVTGYLRTHMLTLTPWSRWLPTPGRRQFQAALTRLDHLVGQHIQARRQQEGDHGDLLALLLAARDPATGAGMSAQQLRDEVMTLLFAGHETTALALTWTWYLLARHPEVAERLRRDLGTVLAGRGPAVADLPHLPYIR